MTLIFLKNIRSISFYELSQRNGKDFLVCLRKEEIRVENELDAENRISFYQAFKDAVKNDLKFTQAFVAKLLADSQLLKIELPPNSFDYEQLTGDLKHF